MLKSGRAINFTPYDAIHENNQIPQKDSPTQASAQSSSNAQFYIHT